ncbi:HNH endonuclease [Pseudoalteromonas sp. T1lg122]|uniref:HNH endonuclease n=1 Tax=Pseudoalteromonas sp. T1lg122 TaxID=2077094 RepID=UPI000CF6602B|nr:HNH endonuclease [Pseudoalteromonas sp. T1lg122]
MKLAKEKRIWLIYVGGNKAILPNYLLGMETGIWGFDSIPKNDKRFYEIKLGDTVLFAHKMSWPKDEGEKPGWFPKFCSDVNQFKCNLDELVVTEVTKEPYEAATYHWPDKLYPHRFNFKVIDKQENIKIRPDTFDVGYSNAIILSIGASGKIVPLDTKLKEPKDKVKTKTEKNILKEQEEPTYSTEGRVYYSLHKRRERDSLAPLEKKRLTFEETGDLCCEVCGFSFYETYGKRGFMYAECHHKNPLADISKDSVVNTSSDDLAIVCANCHRMIHRNRPWLTIDAVRELYEKQRNRKVNKQA